MKGTARILMEQQLAKVPLSLKEARELQKLKEEYERIYGKSGSGSETAAGRNNKEVIRSLRSKDR